MYGKEEDKGMSPREILARANAELRRRDSPVEARQEGRGESFR
jgi:DNA-binding response OmpR family regulator